MNPEITTMLSALSVPTVLDYSEWARKQVAQLDHNEGVCACFIATAEEPCVFGI